MSTVYCFNIWNVNPLTLIPLFHLLLFHFFCQCQEVAVASTCWTLAAVMLKYSEEEEVERAERAPHPAQPHCAFLSPPLAMWFWRWSTGANTSLTSRLVCVGEEKMLWLKWGKRSRTQEATLTTGLKKWGRRGVRRRAGCVGGGGEEEVKRDSRFFLRRFRFGGHHVINNNSCCYIFITFILLLNWLAMRAKERVSRRRRAVR